MSSLGAFVATVEFIEKHDVIKHIWDYGSELIEMMNSMACEFGVERSFKIYGTSCSPQYITLDNSGKNSPELRTLFNQEMVNNGVLIPWISLCYRHGEREMSLTKLALEKTFEVYKKALNSGLAELLNGPVIKPVFRKYN
jgi:glutamate-1-semialdehyde 2,1-aminomutase